MKHELSNISKAINELAKNQAKNEKKLISYIEGLNKRLEILADYFKQIIDCVDEVIDRLEEEKIIPPKKVKQKSSVGAVYYELEEQETEEIS